MPHIPSTIDQQPLFYLDLSWTQQDNDSSHLSWNHGCHDSNYIILKLAKTHYVQIVHITHTIRKRMDKKTTRSSHIHYQQIYGLSDRFWEWTEHISQHWGAQSVPVMYWVESKATDIQKKKHSKPEIHQYQICTIWIRIITSISLFLPY